jgi:hypothetical protein
MSKSPRETASARLGSHREHLIIEVRQNGVLQAALDLAPGKRRRLVHLGSKKSCELWVDLAQLPAELPLFYCESNRFGVLLEPRLAGIVNNGTEFANVAELLRPQGALSALASINDPLSVSLGAGARGMLHLGGYDILFKVERPATQNHRPYLGAGAGGGLLSAFAQETPQDKIAAALALVFALIIFVPACIWLLMAPSQKPTTIMDLPQPLLQTFVHPDHFRYLPKIYGETYNTQQSVHLALQWVQQLQLRWDAEEEGKAFASSVPLLAAYTRQGRTEAIVTGWQDSISQRHDALDAVRTNPKSDRYYSFQKPYPVLVTDTPGGTLGSLYTRQVNRIAAMDATYRSLRSLILSEQDYLGAHYSERGFDRETAFSAPTQENSKTDDLFLKERERFAFAEGWAQRATQSRFFAVAQRPSSRLGEGAQVQRTVAVLMPTGFVAPRFLAPILGWQPSAESELYMLANAEYALGLRPVPPAPQPKAWIDRKEVNAVLIDRREEIRACYEDALRRKDDLEGTLLLRWSIAQTGKAKDIHLVGSGWAQNHHKGLMSCLENLILSWNFPRPRHAAVQVEYPFRFVIEKPL